MIIELRKKAQITIPKEIVLALGLSEGDTLDVRLVDGTIRIEPVAMVSKKVLRAIEIHPNPLRTAPDKYAEGPIGSSDDGLPDGPERDQTK